MVPKAAPLPPRNRHVAWRKIGQNIFVMCSKRNGPRGGRGPSTPVFGGKAGSGAAKPALADDLEALELHARQTHVRVDFERLLIVFIRGAHIAERLVHDR